MASCERRKDIELKKGQNSYRETPSRTAVDLTPDRVHEPGSTLDKARNRSLGITPGNASASSAA